MSVAALRAGFAKREPSAICAHVTQAFWTAFREGLRAALALRSLTLPGAGCLPDFQYVYRQTPGNTAAPTFGVSGLSVHGDVATASFDAQPSGARGDPARFVRGADGIWRLDCCTGRQLDGLSAVPYRVPSTAMQPTLKIGEIVVSDNAAFRQHPPTLDDIVVFHPAAAAESLDIICPDPNEGQRHHEPCGKADVSPATETFIKRVVGLPGDRIAIRDGRVVRNGKLQPEPFAVRCSSSACNFPTPIVVPQGTYYVLGDNRPASVDSREWGPVRLAWMVGIIKR